MILSTTLWRIRQHSPCRDGWAKLLKHLGKTGADNEPLAIVTILDSNGLDDAIWCLRAVSGHDREIRLYAVWCARQVQHLMKDSRSIASLDVAERFANGKADKDELSDARVSALAAGDAAWAAMAAAGAVAKAVAGAATLADAGAATLAAWGACDAARAAWDAALAAWGATWAARAAAGAAWSATWAARDAAGAARDAVEDAQEKELRAVCARITEQSPGN
jgi:hypothetical protein